MIIKMFSDSKDKLENKINNRFDKLEQKIERIEKTPTMKKELN